MKGFRSLLVISGVLLGFIAKLSECTVHYVGGSDGWVLSPFESYNHWAGTHRFQINDTLVFTYQRDDSVLVVNEPDYNTCNTANPIKTLNQGGYSTFKLDRPGPFYFISGSLNRCYHTQKMIIVVLAPRTYFQTPSPSVALPPGTGITPASAPSIGTGVGIAPANAPSETSIGIISPASAPSGPIEGGSAFAPAYGPSQPKPTANAFTTRVSWLVLGMVFMVFV